MEEVLEGDGRGSRPAVAAAGSVDVDAMVAALDVLPIAAALIGPDGNILHMTGSMKTLFGAMGNGTDGQVAGAFFNRQGQAHTWEDRPTTPRHQIFRWADPGGQDKWLSISSGPACVGDQMMLIVCAQDVTDQQQREDDLVMEAQQDPLTHIANRRPVVDRLQALAAAGIGASVAFFDMDGFKAINDTHGHAAGDHVLEVVAQRLAGTVRPDDIVGRWGGDEFVAVLTGLADASIAQDMVQRLRDRIAEPIRLADGSIAQVSATAGVASTPSVTDPTELINEADRAMIDRRAVVRARPSRRAAPTGRTDVRRDT